MTTSNGGRVVEHVDGLVQSSNERGLRLVGEDNYRNFSKYADPPIAAPARGSSVRLDMDASGFVRSVEILSTNIPGASVASSSNRDSEIRRMCAIKVAANVIGQFAQTHEEVRTDHIFPLADRILEWIESES
jgi:hypothetical protein